MQREQFWREFKHGVSEANRGPAPRRRPRSRPAGRPRPGSKHGRPPATVAGIPATPPRCWRQRSIAALAGRTTFLASATPVLTFAGFSFAAAWLPSARLTLSHRDGSWLSVPRVW